MICHVKRHRNDTMIRLRYMTCKPSFCSFPRLPHQWAGKTIALGTFSTAEAEEKCQRAKALTKAWRQNMRPRPSREWVIAELERHGVRIVAGRRGTSDNAILYKKNATSAARAASIVAHAAVSAAHEQHTQQAAAAVAQAAAAGAGGGSGTTGSEGASVGNSAGPGAAGAGASGAPTAAASASGLRESFTAELGGERNDALAAARRDSLGALLGEGMMKRRTSLDSLGFAASLLSSGALDKLGEMDELETSALRRDMVNASAIEGGDLPAGKARRNSSLDLVRFLKSEIGLFDEDGAAAPGAGAAGGVPGSISIAGGGGNDHGAAFAGAGAVMQRRLSNAALQMSLGLGGLSRGIGMDELVASSNPTPGGALGSAAMSRSASAMLGTGPLGGLGGGSSALAAVSGLGPNATPSQHYEMLKLHHMNLLQEIQETTMMMNLYQQQMLQEQQEQLQQQQLASVGAPIGNMMNQVQTSKQSSHNASRGQPDPAINDQALHKQQQQLQGQAGGNPSHNYAGQQAIPGEATDESAEESIRKLRAEIAERESKMKELTSTGDGPESSTANDLKAAKRPRM